jgi:hypothetical protein
VPFDLDIGTSKGALERITQGPARRDTPSLSSNGRNVAFTSDQSGRANIWMRELATGNESIVPAHRLCSGILSAMHPAARIAFSVFEKDKRVVYVSAPGDAPEKLCEGCLQATHWSRDETTLFGPWPAPWPAFALSKF